MIKARKRKKQYRYDSSFKHGKELEKVSEEVKEEVKEDAKVDTADEVVELEPVDINEKLKASDILLDSTVSEDNEMKIEDAPMVEITREAYHKMMTYTKLIDKEIGGLGYVEKISNSRFRITDVFLPKQVVSAAQCECDIDDQCRIMQELIDQGKNPGNLKMWWHSHVKMGCSWSGTDERTSFISACDYFISFVVCHDMSLRCKINICQPMEIELDNIKVVVVDDSEKIDVIETCTEEIKQKVHEEKSTYEYAGYGCYGSDAHGQREFKGFGKEEKIAGEGSDVEKEVEAERDMYRAPYGDFYNMAGYTFQWSEKEWKYIVRDSYGHELTEEQIISVGLEDYVFPYPTSMYNG